MQKTLEIQAPLTVEICANLNVGEYILLSGEIYTGRDMAHRRLYETIGRGETLPINLQNEIMFYAAPTPTRPGQVIGSIGPTTSYRMDAFTPRLIEAGLRGMIGKGKRSSEVLDAINKHNAVYFGAIGGIAALTARCVKKAAVVAYEDLGPEAIMRLEVVRLPLVVINDTKGRDLYREALQKI